MTNPDLHWMHLALDQARLAAAAGEVPVGAVLVAQGRLLASGHNTNQALQDVHSHAELVVLERAIAGHGRQVLVGACLYVTVEPCLMCLGALVATRLGRLVFGAYEPRSGALVSRYQLADHPGHSFDWCGGLCDVQAADLLRNFFLLKRG